eukprot:8501262-Pyramimonas_sp.AAC.1
MATVLRSRRGVNQRYVARGSSLSGLVLAASSGVPMTWSPSDPSASCPACAAACVSSPNMNSMMRASFHCSPMGHCSPIRRWARRCRTWRRR